MYLYSLYKDKDVSSSVHGTVKYNLYDFTRSLDFAVSLNQTISLYDRYDEIPSESDKITLKEGRIYDISLMCYMVSNSYDESVRLSVVDEDGRVICTTAGYNIDEHLSKREFPLGHVTIIPDRDIKVEVKVTEYSPTARKLHKDSHLFIKETDLYDAYSLTETITRKRWLGKPVYRKVIKHTVVRGDNNIPTNINATYCYIDSWNFMSTYNTNISGSWTYYSDEILAGNINKSDNQVQMSIKSDGSTIYAQFPDEIPFTGTLYIIVEYCK